METKATSNGKWLLLGNAFLPRMSQISDIFIFSQRLQVSDSFLCIMRQLRVNCKVWHTLSFWVNRLASVRLKRYKEAFVTFEVLANGWANNWVILDVRRCHPMDGWKYFWCFRNELEALGEKNLEELGSWVCRERYLQSILTWYHWCFPMFSHHGRSSRVTEPGPRMSLVGGARVDVPLAWGSSGAFHIDGPHWIVVIMTTI